MIQLTPKQHDYLSDVIETRTSFGAQRVPNVSLLLAGRRAGKTTVTAVMAKNIIQHWGSITKDEFKRANVDVPKEVLILLSDDIFHVFRMLTDTDNDAPAEPMSSELLRIQGKFLSFLVQRVSSIGNPTKRPCLFAGFEEVAWNDSMDGIGSVLSSCVPYCVAASLLDAPSPIVALNSTPKEWQPKDWFTSWVTDRRDLTAIIGPHQLLTHHYTSWEMNPSFPADKTFATTSWYAFVRDYAAFKIVLENKAYEQLYDALEKWNEYLRKGNSMLG